MREFTTRWFWLLCFCSGLGMAPLAQSQPAAWYQWQSKVTGHKICRQVEPGSGWVLVAGPFLDGGCRVPQSPPSHDDAWIISAQSGANSALDFALWSEE